MAEVHPQPEDHDDETTPPRPAPGWVRRLLLWVALTTGLAPGAIAAVPIERDPPRGRVLRRALRADPKQEYLVYVPPRAAPGAPILVTVHGISRNLNEHAALFAPYAEDHGVILIAPSFTRERNMGYQRLTKDGPGPRADLALSAIVDEVAEATRAEHPGFYLFGYSGGAQFAHRYMMAYPERVLGAVIGAAGWYTFPDDRTPYPYGLGPSEDRSDLRFDPARFLRVPVTVLVGEEDVTSESLRRNDFVDHQQGTTRRQRASKWVAAMNRAARSRGFSPPASYHEVAGIEHSFGQFMRQGGLGDRVFAALFGTSAAAGVSR